MKASRAPVFSAWRAAFTWQGRIPVYLFALRRRVPNTISAVAERIISAPKKAIVFLSPVGGNVEHPYLPCKHREDWGLNDPAGKDDEGFIEVIRQIEHNIQSLRERLDASNGSLS